MSLKNISRKLRAPLNKRDAINKINRFNSTQRSAGELVDFAMNPGTRGLYRIDSVQIREEILALTQAVSSIRPRVILEIGTCNGGTLFIWSHVASELVITCDLNASKVRDELFDYFTPDSSNCEIIALCGDSHAESFRQQVENTLDGKMVDFLFIDGDHTEQGVAIDYENYKGFVRSGGIIAFHDIVEKQPVPDNQVYYFWEKVKAGKKTEEFVRDHSQTGFGIGIIHVE